MAKLNVKDKSGVSVRETPRTHEGAVASRINKELQLRRSVMACMLWEDQFYEEGESVADRIKAAVKDVKADKVAEIALEARTAMKLRHVPLLLAREMARLDTHKHVVARTLFNVIQRADELTEFLAIYWKDGRQALSAQVKKGLASAFQKFDEYALAKYNRDGQVKLKDVLFLSHARPCDNAQEKLWKKLVEGKLKTPDTWEVALSAGKDKKKEFERLLKEDKMGALAILRNLRNFEDNKVSRDVVKEAMEKMDVSRVLPFRFISAAKHAPAYESEIEAAMMRCLKSQKKLKGKTVVIVDVSGSMYGTNVSAKSEISRAHAACALATIIREVSDEVAVYATAGDDGMRVHKTKLVPSRHGFALSDAIYELCRPLGGGGIFLKQVMDYVKEKEKTADRVIVITDEQDCDLSNNPSSAKTFSDHSYLINVGAYRNGIGYGKWTHIDGFSEATVEYIRASEKAEKSKN